MRASPWQAHARILKALANPVRLEIIASLTRGERCLCELQPLFPLNKSTLSRHVTALRRAGIVGERREGVRRILRLQTPCVLRMLDCAMEVIRSGGSRRAGMAGGGKASEP